MRFIDNIYSLVWDISSLFYDAYATVHDWVFPFWYLQYPLWYLYRAFWNLLTPIAQWYEWSAFVISKLAIMLTTAQMTEWLVNIMLILLPIKDFIDNVWTRVYEIINVWWDSVKLIVQAWIDSAIVGFQDLLNTVSTSLANLQTSWDNFTTLTLPTLVTGLEVDSLIESWFKSFTPFWEGWQEWRDKVIEFFSDPEDWLYKAADRIIERFW